MPIESECTHLAMWSGPRNISTAMMRSWGNRTDTFVCDEPFYASYLKETGLSHPGAEEVMNHQCSDWNEVVKWLTGPVPEGKSIFYQKHMAHHLLPHITHDWLNQITHCFLIRDPIEMLPSLDEKFPNPGLQDTGLPQQVEIFNAIRKEQGIIPPVIDSRDLLQTPEPLLRLCCSRLGIPWQESMLSWSPGPRDTDGVWAKYWYHNVEKSTTFQPYRKKEGPLSEKLLDLNKQCQVYYKELYDFRLKL